MPLHTAQLAALAQVRFPAAGLGRGQVRRPATELRRRGSKPRLWARMGRPGTAITFVGEWDLEAFEVIQRHIGDGIEWGKLALYS